MGSKRSFNGSLGRYAKALRRAGFTMEHTKNGHVRITAPDGSSICQGASPGNPNAQEAWLKYVIARGSVATSKIGAPNAQAQARH